MSNVSCKALIQSPRLVFEQAGLHLNARHSEFFKAPAADLRIGIVHRGNHALNSGGDHRIRARRRTAAMGTRLEVNVERGSACLLTRVFEGTNFGMLYAIVSVGSGADDIALRVHDDRA